MDSEADLLLSECNYWYGPGRDARTVDNFDETLRQALKCISTQSSVQQVELRFESWPGPKKLQLGARDTKRPMRNLFKMKSTNISKHLQH